MRPVNEEVMNDRRGYMNGMGGVSGVRKSERTSGLAIACGPT